MMSCYLLKNIVGRFLNCIGVLASFAGDQTLRRSDVDLIDIDCLSQDKILLQDVQGYRGLFPLQ